MNKITDGNRKFLSELVARLAFEDFYRANRAIIEKPSRRENGTKQFNPYSLSEETNEAREMLKIANKLENTSEEVEMVKAYILKRKFYEMSQPKLKKVKRRKPSGPRSRRKENKT